MFHGLMPHLDHILLVDSETPPVSCPHSVEGSARASGSPPDVLVARLKATPPAISGHKWLAVQPRIAAAPLDLASRARNAGCRVTREIHRAASATAFRIAKERR